MTLKAAPFYATFLIESSAQALCHYVLAILNYYVNMLLERKKFDLVEAEWASILSPGLKSRIIMVLSSFRLIGPSPMSSGLFDLFFNGILEGGRQGPGGERYVFWGGSCGK